MVRKSYSEEQALSSIYSLGSTYNYI